MRINRVSVTFPGACAKKGKKSYTDPVYLEDDRFHYDEQRFMTLGLLQGIPVSIVHTETKDHIHIISFRKATRRETAILFENI